MTDRVGQLYSQSVARVIPSDRFSSVVAASARVFITHGYQRTQVQDVADILGLGKGTLYGYAQSKAALFAAAVRYADAHEQVPSTAELPVPTPADGEIATLISERLGREIRDMTLTQALREPLPASHTGADIGLVVADLYQRLARHRIALKLVDRCAPELPELAEVWFSTARNAQVEAVQTFLVQRADAGLLNLPGPAPIVARTIVELCSLWAVHMHFDPAPDDRFVGRSGSADDETIATTLSRLVVRATSAVATN